MNDEWASSAVRYEPSAGVVAERSGNKLVVLHPDGEYVSTLNSIGAIVWECLPADRAELVAALGGRFPDVEPSVLEADLERFIDDVVTRGLVVVASNAGD